MIITNIKELKNICEEVSSLEEEKDIITKLENELESSAQRGMPGIGLAAPQIGINKRVAIIRVDKTNIINLVNSKILKKNDEIISEEGCLSLPSQRVKVKRFLNIEIQNNSFVNNNKFAAYGLSSICIQHEMDHWEGILMTDKQISIYDNIGPNMDCPCGKTVNGKRLKYKKCCKKKGI